MQQKPVKFHLCIYVCYNFDVVDRWCLFELYCAESNLLLLFEAAKHVGEHHLPRRYVNDPFSFLSGLDSGSLGKSCIKRTSVLARSWSEISTAAVCLFCWCQNAQSVGRALVWITQKYWGIWQLSWKCREITKSLRIVGEILSWKTVYW